MSIFMAVPCDDPPMACCNYSWNC